ncbi:helix-turn-helix transcriptional regulator (plasmid) [Paenibacillus peoriae]|uniref:Helix-turn-helix transcriptional regulator n=1 Tax=Paenibacillus peoriae TaxID=59893 RepID=A0A7H0YHJ1_9BACL|nr:helix-turn-helix transcriptional regulator [Paenibacillus peoriae]QNR70549.1 helix-turn-helix transcriptional regulator [Paenibacillus peoriae]
MKLKEARELAKHTQESLVKEIHNHMECSLRHYQNIEYGKKIPKMPLGLLICRICGVDPDDIDEWKINQDNR